ncbi:MAG: CHASE2 domain-containing protein [Desulfobacterales bacterium]
MKKLLSLNPFSITTIVIVLAISAYASHIEFLSRVELITVDLRFTARDRIAPGPYVTMAVIDEKSLAREGKWPWPREKMATLIAKLSDAGAAVITFDIVWSEPDDNRALRAVEDIRHEAEIREIENEGFGNYLTELKAQSDQDMLLADAIKNSKAKIVLGYFFQMDFEGSRHIDEVQIPIHQENILNSRYVYVRSRSPDLDDSILFPEALAPQSNIGVISDAAEYSGTFNMIPDKDNIVRHLPSVFKFRDERYAPISIMSVSAFFDTPPAIELANGTVEALRIGELLIPTDGEGRISINYRGEANTFPSISATDILNDRFSKDDVKGKIILVGVTAMGVYDMRFTPFEISPGLEIHANVVDSILAEDFVYQPAAVELLDILAIIVGSLFLGISLPRTGSTFGALSFCAVFFGYYLLCHRVFAGSGWILNVIYPLSAYLLVYLGITAYEYFSESKQKRFIKGAFSTYLAPTVVKQLMDSPEKLVLGGEEREITAFFSDVQGFTRISEKLTPNELVDLLNEFLTEMTDIVLKYQGTVDKFEGDAIIAMFGAPIDMDNHAEVAAKASVDMQKRLVELRKDWKDRGKPELEMRIGLDTGPAVVGNMGSSSRMDYTMMGNTVNTASRLEGVNKIYGIYTLIGETTYEQAGDAVVSREIDSVGVVGKQEPVKVYEILGYPDDIDDRVRETVEHYHSGLNAYRAQDWDNAIDAFTAALALNPDDGPSKTMLIRCNAFKADPPEADWNGIYTMKTK